MNTASEKLVLNELPSVIIIAGGYSLRMGFPKLLLPFTEKETFVEQIVKVYRQITNQIVLVVNDKVYDKWCSFFNTRLPGVLIIKNLNPEYGRTHSIQLGLEKVHAAKIFIQNCDNPFVKKELLSDMLKKAPNNGYVSPLVNKKGGHPVLLCGSVIFNVIQANVESTLKDIIFSQYRTDCLTEDTDILININTEESYLINFPENMQKFFPNLNKMKHV